MNCTICGDTMHAKGLCVTHYQEQHRDANREKRRQQARDYYAANKDKCRAASDKWEAENAESIKARDAAYREANRDALNARSRAWVSEHPERRSEITRKSQHGRNYKKAAQRAKKVAKERSALAPWANLFFIEEAYHLAALRTKMLGFKWEVDHIVPMSNDIVCGLHVENNLHVVPATHNRKKSNWWWPDMPPIERRWQWLP